MTVSRMRANFGEGTISLPIEPLRDKDLILPDFKQNADFKFCVINGLIPGKLYIKKNFHVFSLAKTFQFKI